MSPNAAVPILFMSEIPNRSTFTALITLAHRRRQGPVGPLLLVLAAGALYAAQAGATQRYTDKRLDVDLGLADQGLILRNRQNFRAYDCRVAIDDKFFAVKVTIPGGRETLLPFGQFRTLNNTPYDPALEIRVVRIQCLEPTLRLRTFRRR